jgi:hypothetical protein
MSFDLDAVREWGNWPELPDVKHTVLCGYWRKLVSDVLAACDEIERLQTLLEQKASVGLTNCEHPGWDGSSLYYCKVCGYHVQVHTWRSV